MQPAIRHFDALSDAADFLGAQGGGRALGFFSAVDAPEHAVFLTVARQVVGNGTGPSELRFELGNGSTQGRLSNKARVSGFGKVFMLSDGAEIFKLFY